MPVLILVKNHPPIKPTEQVGAVPGRAANAAQPWFSRTTAAVSYSMIRTGEPRP